MGFFRFRRSIKILPGVRWNIGKKSSSLSFGGKGFHYTVGTRGRRTTVGLPGTGLSYTSTSRSAASKRRDDEKAAAWAAKQHKTVHIEYPDREPGEGAATRRQIDYIRSLAPGIDENALSNLGKKQASALVSQIKKEKEQFTQEKVQEYARKSRGLGCGSAIGVCVLVLIGIVGISSFFNHPDSPLPMPAIPQINLPRTPESSPIPSPRDALKSATSTANPATGKDVQSAERLAVQRYPELGIANSPLNAEFVKRYNQRKHTDPSYFNDPQWPMTLANECSEYLKQQGP